MALAWRSRTLWYTLWLTDLLEAVEVVLDKLLLNGMLSFLGLNSHLCSEFFNALDLVKWSNVVVVHHIHSCLLRSHLCAALVKGLCHAWVLLTVFKFTCLVKINPISVKSWWSLGLVIVWPCWWDGIPRYLINGSPPTKATLAVVSRSKACVYTALAGWSLTTLPSGRCLDWVIVNLWF